MKVKNGKETITTQIAYIAGFFDGEGCIRIKKASQGGNSYYIWVAITNADKDTLNFIANLFNGKIRRAEKKVNKWVYHFLITSSEAVDMLKVLIPFLRQKTSQAALAVWFHEHKDKLTPKEKRQAYERMGKLKR